MLEGHRVVVAGASGGVGMAIARACLAEGATVGAHGLSAFAAIERLREEHPERVVPLRFDVRDPSGLRAETRRFEALVGGIDAWVSAAGCGGRPAFLVHARAEQVQEVVDTHLVGTIHCASAVLPYFIRAQRGVLLHLSSCSVARPEPGLAAYVAAKAGVEGLTRALAAEHARFGVRVVCLRLGPIATGLVEQLPERARERLIRRMPLGRLVAADDVGRFAAYLLSARCQAMTGGVHALDAGAELA